MLIGFPKEESPLKHVDDGHINHGYTRMLESIINS